MRLLDTVFVMEQFIVDQKVIDCVQRYYFGGTLTEKKRFVKSLKRSYTRVLAECGLDLAPSFAVKLALYMARCQSEGIGSNIDLLVRLFTELSPSKGFLGKAA